MPKFTFLFTRHLPISILLVAFLSTTVFLLPWSATQAMPAQAQSDGNGPVATIAHTPEATADPAQIDTVPYEPEVTLRWFMRWDAERIRTVAVPILVHFREQQPEIRVALENVSNSSAYYRQLRLQIDRGRPPDVLYLATHAAYELQLQDALLPLDDLLSQDELTFQRDGDNLLEFYRNERGQLYCLPVDVATMAVVYNRARFDEENIAYPQAPWTWEEFLATAADLSNDQADDDGLKHYGTARLYSYWPLFIWGWTGHNVFDDPRFPTEFLLEEEASVKALQWLADLHQIHKVMPPIDGETIIAEDIDGTNKATDLFLAGRAAMQIAGYWQIPSYLAAGLDIGVTSLPQEEVNANRSDGSCLAIAQTTLYPAEAWAFVKYLLGTEGIGAAMIRAQMAAEPSVKALYEQSFVLNPFSLSAGEAGEDRANSESGGLARAQNIDSTLTNHDLTALPLYDPFGDLYEEWNAIAKNELQGLWQGRRNADQTVGRMANAAEDLLEDLPVTRTRTMNLEINGRTKADLKIATNALTQTLPLTDSQLITGHLIPQLLAAELFATDLPTTALPILNNSLPVTMELELATVISNTTMVTGTKSTATKSAATTVKRQRLPHHYFVNPAGDDTNSGLHSSVPFATIQHALNIVGPGDTIHLAAGDYYENLTSVTAGADNAPITIVGPMDAILRGSGEASAAFYVTHSYYTLTGFTIDGLFGDPTLKEGYTQKLLYVQGTGDKRGVTGLRVLHMHFRNAGGECVRLRYFAQHNEIAYSTFQVCGLLDFVFDDGGKNGEGIYIGTAADQWADGKNPTVDPDESSHNWIHHNEMDTQGNECVEVKEGGYANIIEYNLCTGQLDPDSAGIGARGQQNIIRYNTIYGNIGAAIRLGGHEVDGIQYGTDNFVYGNYLLANIAGGVKIINEPQARICSNYLAGNVGKESFGDSSEDYDPAQPC